MKLENRHWIFLGLFLVVGITMGLGLEVEVTPSPYTEQMYAYIDSLPEGSVIMMSFDHEASSLPEIKPVALAVIRHAFQKKHKIIGVSLFAEGTLIGYRLLYNTANEFGYTYGDDYLYLGFRPQYIAAILSMGESIEATYPEDYLGTPYKNFSLARQVVNYNDISAVISVADGSRTTDWIEYGGQFNINVLGAVTAAMVTSYDPYLASGQLKAMTGGLRGAAEYEKMIAVKGGGARGMLAQSATHVYVIVLIVIGNAIYFRQKRKKE